MNESNAPEHVIGTGSLEVKPKMQAVDEAMDKIERRLDVLTEKFAKVFDTDALKKFEDGLDRIVEKANSLSFDGATTKLKQDLTTVFEQMKAVQFQSPQTQPDQDRYRSIMEDARRDQDMSLVVSLLTDISSKLDNIQSEQAAG